MFYIKIYLLIYLYIIVDMYFILLDIKFIFY